MFSRSIKLGAQKVDISLSEFITSSLDRDEFEIIPLAGDASSRRYFRVVSDNHSWVLMSWEPFSDDGTYPFLNVLSHFAKHGVHVPKVIGKAPDKGLILLEDLGDLTLERKFWEVQDQNLVLPFYQQAIDELIKIHYAATSDRNDCTAFKVEFDTAKLLWEMNYGREHLIQKLADLQLTSSENKELDRIFTDICQRLDQEEKHICHRDYHSRNLMITLTDMRVIDFQDARMGPIQYDLVSLVHDSYVDLAPDFINQILDYYIIQANKVRAQPVERSLFDSIFEIQLIQRCFKACGSFASFKNTRGDTRYLKYIQPTLKKIAACLENHPDYSGFLDILGNKGLLEKDYSKL